MFSVFIPGINLTDPSATWFDVNIYQTYVSDGFTMLNKTKTPLVPCTEEHLSITEGIKKDY